MNQNGQAQLLTASVLGTVMLMAAVTALQYSHQTQTSQIQGGQKTEIKTALEEAIRIVHRFYQSEFSCDPIALNNAISLRLTPAGTLGPLRLMDCPDCRRQIQVRTNDHIFLVSIGRILPLEPTRGSDVSGQSQDATIEVWTQFGSQRITQIAALINNCNYPCAMALTEEMYTGIDPCLAPNDPRIAYSWIPDTATYPTAGSAVSNPDAATWNLACQTESRTHYLGDVKFRSPGLGFSNRVIDLRDILILRNYLRSGDTSGSRQSLLSGRGNCADLNRDGLVNEADLGILEKLLRGYLYWVPTINKHIGIIGTL